LIRIRFSFIDCCCLQLALDQVAARKERARLADQQDATAASLSAAIKDIVALRDTLTQPPSHLLPDVNELEVSTKTFIKANTDDSSKSPESIVDDGGPCYGVSSSDNFLEASWRRKESAGGDSTASGCTAPSEASNGESLTAGVRASLRSELPDHRGSISQHTPRSPQLSLNVAISANVIPEAGPIEANPNSNGSKILHDGNSSSTLNFCCSCSNIEPEGVNHGQGSGSGDAISKTGYPASGFSEVDQARAKPGHGGPLPARLLPRRNPLTGRSHQPPLISDGFADSRAEESAECKSNNTPVDLEAWSASLLFAAAGNKFQKHANNGCANGSSEDNAGLGGWTKRLIALLSPRIGVQQDCTDRYDCSLREPYSKISYLRRSSLDGPDPKPAAAASAAATRIQRAFRARRPMSLSQKIETISTASDSEAAASLQTAVRGVLQRMRTGTSILRGDLDDTKAFLMPGLQWKESNLFGCESRLSLLGKAIGQAAEGTADLEIRNVGCEPENGSDVAETRRAIPKQQFSRRLLPDSDSGA
jgi:hypothetical protein